MQRTHRAVADLLSDPPLERQIAAAQEQLVALKEQLERSDTDVKVVIEMAIEELSDTLEELHVAQEELQQQNRELNKAQEQLATQWKRYHDLYDFAPDGYLVTDSSGIILEANRAAVDFLDDSRDNLQHKPFSLFFHKEERASVYAKINRLHADATAMQEPWETRLRSSSRHTFHAAITAAPGYDENGDLDRIRWLIRDITARKRMEKRLRFQAQLLSAVEQAIVAVDTTGRILYWNHESETLFGWSVEEAIGRDVLELLPTEETWTQANGIMDQLIAGQSWSGEFSLQCSDGHTFPSIVTASPIEDPGGDVIGAIGVITDITQRVATERKAERYSQRMTGILESIRDGFFVLNDDLRVIYYNQAAELILGKNREDVVGHQLFEAFPEAQGTIFERKYRQAIQNKQAMSFETHFHVEPYDDWYAVNVYPRENGLSVYFQVVTERKEAEAALRQSREFLNATGRVANVGGWQVDIESEDVRWTEQTYRIHEVADTYEPDYDTLLNFYHSEARPRLDEAAQRAIDQGKAFDMDLRLITAKGNQRWVRLLCEPRRVNGKTVKLVGAIQDITEQKEMAEQLRHQEQLAALGEMAGGIAHDFNNLLASIILYAQLPLNRHADLPHDVIQSFETILTESDRAAQLVQQILDFSRRAILETEPLDLVPFTQDVINVLKRTIPENIRIELNLACRHCVIEADPTRIQQVLINLALNARDAMPGGGKLWIDLASMNLDPNDPPPIPGMDPGEWAHLRVSDTGIGMTNEVMEHLFEPFFTTKEPGRGTGLGLSQVYGIVKQHEGYIDVESKPHKGSTFSIYLPAETPAVNEQENWAPEEVATGQGETILLVEDADALRAAIESFLESLGYRVLSAENGRKALQLAASEKLDMLITDIVMPEMGGAELLHHIRRVDPDLKAIAITGHMLHAETVSLLDAGFDEHMSKPFDTKQLSAIIQTLLEEENPS